VSVALGEAVRFIAFEALFVVLPGCLFYALVSPAREGWLRLVAIGWPCGYALEVALSALGAALHARAIVLLLPPLALLVGALRWRSLRAGAGGQRTALAGAGGQRAAGAEADWRSECLPMAILTGLGLLILALVIFAGSPLPGHVHSVVYNPDNVADLSWAAEARYHWPITLPFVAGQPAHYYIATFIHMATVNQVTRVPLPTIVLRLFPATMIVVIALQLWAICRSLAPSRWLAPVAIALFLLVEDLNLDPTRPQAFAVDVFNTIPHSPTYAFGATFFLGALVLTQRWLLDASATRATEGSPSVGWRADRGARVRVLAVLGLLMLGAGASKTSAVADFLGGLGLYWLWLMFRGRPARLPLYGVAVAGASLLVVYRFVLSGGYASNLGIHPFTFIHYTVVAPLLLGQSVLWPSFGGHPITWYVLLAAAVPAVTVCALTPLLGAVWLLRPPRAASDFTVLALAMFVVSLAAYMVLGAPGNSQGYFLVYGYIALIPLAAQGIVELWLQVPAPARGVLVGACAALLALGLAIAATTPALAGAGSTAWHAWYVAAYGAIAIAIAVAVWRLQRRLLPVVPSRAWRALACVIPLLCTLGLVKPLAEAFPMAWKTVLGRQTWPADSRGERGMTLALYRGLTWVRDHTSPCAVVAVNNHYADAGQLRSYYDYYSAFAQRRVFLESWYGTPGGELGGKPYPARLALNEQAVLHGSPTALRALAADGVGYVLIDETHGSGAPEPAEVSRLVFANDALSVYRLSPPPSAGRARPGCGMVSGI
jgi:hypothetical protein